jgi:hypothetical protein
MDQKKQKKMALPHTKNYKNKATKMPSSLARGPVLAKR